jgi:hypothetical protein
LSTRSAQSVIVRDRDKSPRRYLVIAPGTVGNLGAPVQVQAESSQ